MSFAISATIKPSRSLRWLSLAMCLCIIAAAASIGFGVAANDAFSVRMAVSGVCLIFAFFALFQAVRDKKTFRIDISSNGKIRIMQDESGQREMPEQWETVHLTEASTLWPGVMFLCLESDRGQTTVLRILPDSVSAEEFRALSVACRWIVARRNRQDGAM